MLVADVFYKVKGEELKLKGYLSDFATNTLGRFVATDGDSARMLMDGFNGDLNKQNRSFSLTLSTISIERLFKAGVKKDAHGEDISKPKYYSANFQSAKFFAEFATLFLYAKKVKSSKTFLADETRQYSLEAKKIDSSSVKDYINTGKVKGYVTRKYGIVTELDLSSKNMRILITTDDDFEKQPYGVIKKLMGSNILIMESEGTAYKIPISEKMTAHLTGEEKKETTLQLRGINSDSYSPFYQTVEQVVKAHPDKNFNWIKERIDAGDYKIVTPQSLESDIEQIKRDYEVLKVAALDSETDGLDFNFKCFTGEGSKIVGAVLSAKAGTSYYFPLGHTKIENLCGGNAELFLELYFKPLFGYMNLVLHNNVFDWKVFYRHGLPYMCYFDTMVFVNNTLRARDGVDSGLKSLTERYLHRDSPELDDLCLNGDFNTTNSSFADLEPELVRFYACPDADNTLSLYLYFRDNGIIDEMGAWKSALNNSAFSSVIAYSEFYGMHLDLEAIPALRAEYTAKLDKAMERLLNFIEENVPSVDLRTYKVNSKVNLEIAYDKLGYPVQTNSKSGNPTLDADAVDYLSNYTKSEVEPFSISSKDVTNLFEETNLSSFTLKGKALEVLKNAFDSELVGVSEDIQYTLNKDLSLTITNVDEVILEKSSEEVLKEFKTHGVSFVYLPQETLSTLRKKYKELGLDTEYQYNFEGNYIDVKPEKEAPLYPFIKLLKEARDLSRVFTTFLDKIDTNFTSDGFCFSKVDQFKVTGRLSTSSPNYQGFDDLTKKEITAREGYYTVDMDYASKENRVIAIASGEKALLDMFQDWRNDYHRFQSSRMHGIPQELVTGALRNESKGIVFGINFGMSDASLGARLFGERNALNTMKATEKRKLFFSFQRSVEVWFENNVRVALEKGYSETILGSRRFYNQARTSKSQIRRYALNHPIQGSAADIYKMGMVSLFKDLIKLGYLGKVLVTGFIHDEALFEFHNSIHPHVALGLIRKNMMVEFKGGCPLHLGFGVGRSWYDAKKTEWQVGLQEKLEWDEDAYKWDGNISSYYDWSKNQIHLYNAEDTMSMLESKEYEGKLFPVNYGLELNSYLSGEIPNLDSYVNALKQFKHGKVDYAEYAGIYLNSSDESERLMAKNQIISNLKKEVFTLHIHDRLLMFKELTGYHYEDMENKFIDVSEIEKNLKKEEEITDDVEERMKREERERALQLIKDQIVDFGYRLDLDSNSISIIYTKELYNKVKTLFVLEEDIVGDKDDYLSVYFYNFQVDKFKFLKGSYIRKSDVSTVSELSFSAV